MGTPMYMRNLTRVAMSLFGRLLAEDVEEVNSAGGDRLAGDWRHRAENVLHELDHLDDSDDPEVTTSTADMLNGETWLQLAEGRGLDEDYIAHVLFQLTSGEHGYAPPRFVKSLLIAIDQADQDHRDALALAFPEYVGLWTAVLRVPGTEERLVDAMRRSA